MAVSFKVPASPKKDIFDIDTFLGVDLTNSGADMDEVRSPNAENMVRYVPGKVRKRVGYKKQVFFGTNTNLNYAIGTSPSEIEFSTKKVSDPYYSLFDLYNLLDEFTRQEGEDVYCYIELDCKVVRTSGFDTEVSIGYEYDGDSFRSLGTISLFEGNQEWIHYSFHRQYLHNFKKLKIRINNENQDVYIKNFSIMKTKDENYKYSPAPDSYVEKESNDAVYGGHVARTNSDYEGNRVVNVNRALNTSSTVTTMTIGESDTTLYQLAETLCEGAKIYIDLDLSGEGGTIVLRVGGAIIFLDSSTNMEHYSLSGVVGTPTSEVTANKIEGTEEISFKNVSVMYDRNDSYEWSQAPEDTGGTFHTEDLYYLSRKNYAVQDTMAESSTSSWSSLDRKYLAEHEYFIIADASDLLGFEYVSFDASTYTEKECTKVTVSYRVGTTLKYKHFDGNINKENFEIYVNDGENVISSVKIEIYSDAQGKCDSRLENLKVKKLTLRGAFDVSRYWTLIHNGSDFYVKTRDSQKLDKVYSGAAKHTSRSWQMNGNLYIIDGQSFYGWEVGKGTVEEISQDNAYIPTLTIAKEPTGGGVAYESLNLIQPGFIELFQGQASKTQYQLTFGGLDDSPVKVWLLNSAGSWEDKQENVDYTVNRSTGKVTFTTAPGVSPITGEDNIKILAYRTVKDYRERITKCTHGTLYGIGGAGDRLFLAGNPDHPNWDFYSQQYDPTYFPDTNYATLGSEQSLITGYAIVNNYLATFKDGFDQSQAVFIREGDLLKKTDDAETTEPVFKLINTLQGEGVVAPYTFGYIQTEPLFLTKQGIYAITEQDITGEKYTQSRSFYLNGKLRKEPNPENAMACIYDDQYILALNNKLYILDGLQATRTDKSEPYATRQYAGFYCTNVPATCIWQDDGVLFGTNDGRVCEFYDDIETLGSYNDDGKPIYACWETPDLDGRLFYKNKTFRYFAVRLMQAIKTSVKMYSRKLGVWNFIREETVIGNPIDFNNFDFDLFTFSQDTSEKVIHTKVRVKKVDKARFRVENGKVNEPFGLFDLALEYIESGNYKG